MKVLVKSALGSDVPTKAAFPHFYASPAILVQLIEWQTNCKRSETYLDRSMCNGVQ